jgi:hypothetical protein
MTCTTCFTLNPEGAPACVRCNTPLGRGPGSGPVDVPGLAARVPAQVPAPPDPTAGSKRIGPGLAAGAKNAPGSSQQRRAGVRFSCTAADGTGTRREVTVSVLDNSGKYTWALRTA